MMLGQKANSDNLDFLDSNGMVSVLIRIALMRQF